MHKKKAKIIVIGKQKFYDYCIGDAGSGKSSLIQTYVKKNYQFSSDYIMVTHKFILFQTQGAQIYSKIIAIPQSNIDIQLFLFDLSGHQFYQPISLSMSKNPDLVMVVYDCTNQQSLKNSLKWLDKIKKYNNKSSINGVLVATKCQYTNCKQISTEQGLNYAKKLNLQFFQVSACYKTNIEKPFQLLAEKILQAPSTSFS